MIDNLGKLLKQKRKEKGLSMEQAGKLLGVSKVTYREYELGTIKSARMNKVDALANFLEVSPEQLFYGGRTSNNVEVQEISKEEFKSEVLDLLSKTSQVNNKDKKIILNALDLVCDDENESK